MSDISLPTGWTKTTLGEVLISVIGGGTPSRKNLSFFNGHIPWFTVKDMKTLKPNDAEEHISETAIASSAANLIPANTLIVATRIALGRAIKPSVTCAINQDLKALVPGSGINSDYLLYWFGANQRVIQELGSGTTVSGIRLETLHSLTLSLPPSAEQTRIVEKLDEIFSELDAGVAELKAAQKKLAQYRQSLLKAAVTGELTAEWRRNNSQISRCSSTGAIATAKRPPLYERGDRGDLPPDEIPLNPPLIKGDLRASETGAQLLERILKERRARWEEKQLARFKEQGKTPPKGWRDKYPEPVRPDTTNLPELPEGWVWASVDQVGEVFLGKMLDKTKHQTGAKLHYLRNISVRWGNIETHDLPEMYFEDDELERYGLVAGDVLVCEGGEPGRAAVCGKEHEVLKYQKALHRVRLFSSYASDILVFYLEHSAKTGMLEQYFTGSTIKHFTKESFIALPIPLPPIDEQTKIVEHLKSVFYVAQEQDFAINYSLAQAAAQRKNILKSAFSGQLVPQDPNDEPASVLLERIRAERAKRAEREKKGKRRNTKRKNEKASLAAHNGGAQ